MKTPNIFRLTVLAFMASIPAAAWSASLVGDDVQGSLNGGFFTSVATPFTTLPVQVINPGQEFEGVVRTTGYADDFSYPFDTRVSVDIFDTYFTITLTADNEWTSTGVPGGPRVGGFGVGGTSTLFDISLTSLDFPGGINSVRFDPSLSSGFFGTAPSSTGTSDIRFINWTATSVDIGYAWSREATTYGFNLVPIPAAVWLFGSGLLGLIGIAKIRLLRVPT